MGIIGSIRKHSWVAVLIVGIAIVAFIIGDLRKNSRQDTFAAIDGNKITYDYFNYRLSQREKENQMEGTNSYAFRDYVWQEIIQERLLDKEMSALGIEVSDEEVSDMFLGRFIHQWVRQQFTNPQTGAFDAQLMNNVVRQYSDMPDTKEPPLTVSMPCRAPAVPIKSTHTPEAFASPSCNLSFRSFPAKVPSKPASTIAATLMIVPSPGTQRTLLYRPKNISVDYNPIR